MIMFYSSESCVITGVLIREKQAGQSQKGRWDDGSGGWGGEVVMSHRMWIPLEGKKHSPLEPPQKNTACGCLDFSPERLVLILTSIAAR